MQHLSIIVLCECPGKKLNPFIHLIYYWFITAPRQRFFILELTNMFSNKNYKDNLKALAKRSQHFNATSRNIVGPNMSSAFGHPVAVCCEMLGVVWLKFEIYPIFHAALWMLRHVIIVWSGSCNNVVAAHAH